MQINNNNSNNNNNNNDNNTNTEYIVVSNAKWLCEGTTMLYYTLIMHLYFPCGTTNKLGPRPPHC